MSKGPGRIQRAISAAFAAEPDNAFTTSELCERVYGSTIIETKHRIALIRAAKKTSGVDHHPSELLGSEIVFYNLANVQSYGMMRLKSDGLNRYRSKDQRLPHHQIKTEADLRAKLANEQHQELMREGGMWWLYTELAKATADGDLKRVRQVQKTIDSELKSLGYRG
jgi:hypothetical protein